MKLFLSIPFLAFSFLVNAQTVIPETIALDEKRIQEKLETLRNAMTDAEKDMANSLLMNELKKVIIKKDAFSYPFDSLKTMGTIVSPDKSFRLFNWNVEQEDGSQKYYCFVVKASKNKYRNSLIELKDQSHNMVSQPDDLTLDNNKWYGALYYKIIPVRKGSKTLYTLLSWDGNNRLTTKKFVDVMYFQGARKAKFGYPIFKDGKSVKKRYFLEFASGQYVSLKHQKGKKTEFIVYSHLSPKAPQLEGLYEHYVVDGSYDALKFEEGYWRLNKDVDQKNPGLTSGYNDPIKGNFKTQQRTVLDDAKKVKGRNSNGQSGQ